MGNGGRPGYLGFGKPGLPGNLVPFCVSPLATKSSHLDQMEIAHPRRSESTVSICGKELD